MASRAHISATRWPYEGPPLLSPLGGLALVEADAGEDLVCEGAGACGRTLGKETAPVEGMCWFATSHSIASLAAYCFASFLRAKMVLVSPSGERRSPMVTRQVNSSRPGLDSW